MKTCRIFVRLLLSLVINSSFSFAQTTWGDSLTLRIEAIVQPSPPQIKLLWEADADAEAYLVYRKLPGETLWHLLIEAEPAITSHIDNDVVTNMLYDYKIVMQSTLTPDAYGYLTSGIYVEHNVNKGVCILVSENTYSGDSDFAETYATFRSDILADGWIVKEISVHADDAPEDVKNLILDVYNTMPAVNHCLILLGHVPVPYSGNIYPDGHTDHQGAWPTDTYYADMDGTWTDVSVNVTSASDMRNQNVPGDGKFDQSYIPSSLELEAGRIDFYDLPAFTKSEKELLIEYMQKNHAFKVKEIKTNKNALIDDNFLSYSEGFSQNGYRNFTPLLTDEHIYQNDYLTELSFYFGSGETYLWSYGCGGGWYQGASGVADTYAFSNDSLNTIFTMLFGSYFGDWDNTNNFLRAALAQGNTLTNCWAGRPNWHFYAMAMGLPIGYCSKLTQNNSATYFSSTIGGLSKIISINLLGDPTLRMQYVAPPTNFVINISFSGSTADMTWEAPEDTDILGYNIFRKHVDSLFYEKRNTELISGTSFSDPIDASGNFTYLLQAVQLETTPSGTYYNHSLGLMQEIDLAVQLNSVTNQAVNIYPNPTTAKIHVSMSNTSGYEMYIYNANDMLVFNKKVSGGSAIVDIEKLPAGIYTIACRNDQGIVHKQIVKI